MIVTKRYYPYILMVDHNILKKEFYLNPDLIKVSKSLLGKIIETNINNKKTSGVIVETEAYAGLDDKASHAYKNKLTRRNQKMFDCGGISYVYICYGIHTLFNVVANSSSYPQAVLIRAIEPILGIKYMLKRRDMQKLSHNLTSGPGKLSQALGLTLKENGLTLQGPTIRIYDVEKKIANQNIIASPRVGVDYAGKDALNPWRFRVRKNPWCSK